MEIMPEVNMWIQRQVGQPIPVNLALRDGVTLDDIRSFLGGYGIQVGNMGRTGGKEVFNYVPATIRDAKQLSDLKVGVERAVNPMIQRIWLDREMGPV